MLNYSVGGFNNYPNVWVNSNQYQQRGIRANNVAFTAQPDMFVLNSQAQVLPEKTEKSGISKLGLGALALAGLGVAACVLSKGKVGAQPVKELSKPIKELAKHIEFKEAKTMEEAVKYAKEHLGITKFNVGNDLETANWLNEGLTRISNAYKGRAPIPNSVGLMPEKLCRGSELRVADINALTGEMRVNTQYFDKVKNLIKNNMDKLGIKVGKPNAEGLRPVDMSLTPFFNIKKQEALIPDICKLIDGSASKFEIEAIHSSITDLYHFNKIFTDKPELIYNQVLKSEKLKKVFDANKDINVLSLDKFKALSQNEKYDYLFDLNDKILKGKSGDELCGIFSDIRIADRKSSVFHAIEHEIGHSAHFSSIGKDAFCKKTLLSEAEKDIAATISGYAITDACEFVAEVYAELMAGGKVSKEVMDLYKKFGGPIIG